MKRLIKNSYLFLIFFLIFIFKDNIYGLLIKTNANNLNEKIMIKEDNHYKEEYYDMNTLLDIPVLNYSYEYSKTLYRDIYDFYDEITILKGKNHNLKKDDAVINHKGLIGVISKVTKNSSTVTLITNKKSSISVKVNESYGILKNIDDKLIITSISNYKNINIGDIIYTSGLGNIKEGIKVGTVKEVISSNLGIEQLIVVNPFVDMNDINYVVIIKGE